jgi:Phage Mu protein F like protein.
MGQRHLSLSKSESVSLSYLVVAGSDLQQLREYMLESLTDEGWTIDGVADQLMQLDGVESQDRAELIARTETASVVNSAREEGYQANDQADDKFYWTGAIDDRTTDACEWLIRQTNPNYGGTPVELKDLQDLIAEAPEHDDSMQNDLARPEN